MSSVSSRALGNSPPELMPLQFPKHPECGHTGCLSLWLVWTYFISPISAIKTSLIWKGCWKDPIIASHPSTPSITHRRLRVELCYVHFGQKSKTQDNQRNGTMLCPCHNYSMSNMWFYCSCRPPHWTWKMGMIITKRRITIFNFLRHFRKKQEAQKKCWKCYVHKQTILCPTDGGHRIVGYYAMSTFLSDFQKWILLKWPPSNNQPFEGKIFFCPKWT